jgi:citrate lyase subunit beta/citryl-CoA lyase
MNPSSDFDARSLLFIPADAERFIARGAERGADVIILDLEDGVAPASKDKARAALPAAVKRLRAGGATVYVRVNNELLLLPNDVAAAVASGADGIVLPKVESPLQLEELDADLAREEHFAGRSQQSVRTLVLIETPQGVVQAAAIARASSRLVALCFGAEDFSTAMGIDPLAEGMSGPAQSVAIAAAAGIEPLGLPGTVGDFSDPEAYRALAVHARRIGMRGAVCIHPAQVPVLNEVFGGTDAEAAAAQRLVDAFDAGIAQGQGAIALDGKMIDAPIATRARRFLQRRLARLARQQASSPAGSQR